MTQNRDALRAESERVLAMMEPTTIGRFAVEVERLAAHYPENRLTPGEQKVVKADWWRLLGHVPLDLMQTGVDRYVLSPARFFPTPGQFLAGIAEDLRYRQVLADRAKELLVLIANHPAQPKDQAA